MSVIEFAKSTGMFKFDFNLEDTEDEVVDIKSSGNPIEEESTQGEERPPLVTYQVQDLASDICFYNIACKSI
jgi:hypothetical protein